MRAPRSPTTTVDELVDTIVESFKPTDPSAYFRWRKQGKEAEASAAVRREIDLLRRCRVVFSTTARTRARDEAHDLIMTVKKLENQLKRIERESPGLFGWLGLPASCEGMTTIAWRMPNLRPDIATLREASEEWVRFRGKQDDFKRMCVRFACVLIANYSENKPTINHTNLVAGLLYQAVTGLNPKTDFLWLCQQILKHFRKPKRNEA
jgi:hypothetical protein